MITFTPKHDNRQYIQIRTSQDTQAILAELTAIYPALAQLPILYDRDEILIPLKNNINYGFNLNQLRTVTGATVGFFAVDLAEPNQRYY